MGNNPTKQTLIVDESSPRVKDDCCSSSPELYETSSSDGARAESYFTAKNSAHQSSILTCDMLNEQMKRQHDHTIPCVFIWNNQAEQVFVTGSFCDWNKFICLNKISDEFMVIINLPIGTHHFKYIIDGVWVHDPKEQTVDDNYGGKNNIIIVKPSDNDVFVALNEDESEKNNLFTSSGSPCGEYSDIKDSADFISKIADESCNPPFLPHSALISVLNKNKNLTIDPSILVEPDHISVNHLFALAIKDKVVSLSTTTRYRKKYVTTILYRPIS